MTRPRTTQEFIHWLEMGTGSRWIAWAALSFGVVAFSSLVAWKQFHGPASEVTLVQADTAWQLAAGEGFTTRVNFPQTAAVLHARGTPFDPAVPYPELHHAPLYSLVVAAALRLLPGGYRASLFASPPVPPDGFAADYFLLAINVGLLWWAAWLTFTLGRRLFEPRVGATAAVALLVSAPVWQQTVKVNGLPLLMVLALIGFHIWFRAEEALSLGHGRKRALGWLAALGAVCGLLFLAEYSAGALVVVVLGYAGARLRGAHRIGGIALVVAGFALLTTPWLIRNVSLTGNPVALASQNVALKAGDPTAEPATFRATFSPEGPRLDLNKLGNKALTALQENLTTRFWSGGALWLAAFFVVGVLYSFRSPTAERLRWIFLVALGVWLLAQGTFNSGESERWATIWCVPLVLIFGAAFFFVLLSSNVRLKSWPGTAMAILLFAQALPLAHDLLEPRRLHFHYPPYFPALFQGMRTDLARRSVEGRVGLMADVPAGVAWYAGTRAWAQPSRLRDFYALTLEQPMGQLLLTPRTLDRPFFTELNARTSPTAGALTPGPGRFGEWGNIYAGLLTGTMPAEFPLRSSQKLAENLFVLFDPSLPVGSGK